MPLVSVSTCRPTAVKNGEGDQKAEEMVKGGHGQHLLDAPNGKKKTEEMVKGEETEEMVKRKWSKVVKSGHGQHLLDAPHRRHDEAGPKGGPAGSETARKGQKG